jgi:broad specificity phosphatase PhoE
MDKTLRQKLSQKIIWYQRHGEGHHNVVKQGFFQSAGASHDPSLTATGKEQARHAGKQLINTPIELVIYSLSKRTQQTMRLMIKELPKKPRMVAFAPLHEYFGGEIEGKMLAEPPVKIQMKDLQGAETSEHLHARVLQALTFIARQPEKHILIVAHSRIGRMFLYCSDPAGLPIDDFDKNHIALSHEESQQLIF